MYKKIITTLMFTVISIFVMQSKVGAEPISKTLAKHNINKNTVSISVKDVKTGNIVYELNSKSPKNPASTLKLVTFAAAKDTLGDDYRFKTELYKSTNNDLYLKLGADPYLTTRDLKNLLNTAKDKNIVEPKNIYIDSTIFDNQEWGEGWQWDDDLNSLMPKFSAYNLDKNFLGIIVAPTIKDAPANIYTEKFYPVTFLNLVKTGDFNNISFKRNNHISPDILTIEGTINKQKTFYIPNNNPQRYFKIRTEDAIRESKLEYYKDIQNKKLPLENIYLVDIVEHDFNQASIDILKNSNNYVAETVYKLAGAKYSNSVGSNINSQKMLNNYLDKINVKYDDIKVVDGSGVSKNNLVTADFMTEFLVKQIAGDETFDYVKMLPKPTEGTLQCRMLYLQDKLNAKTGTLADVSAIAGYLTTLKGKTYAFDIMITDPKTTNVDKKEIEEFIIRAIFSSY